ncbi:MAG TPA: hypothetical protein VKT70_09660 [Stellaceae bacterium]|nr:hypothetical protein [Stellaceae bacterium]
MCEGLTWTPAGLATLSGPLALLHERLDALFRRVAARFAAEEHHIPPLIDAASLARIDWFGSFPHLASFVTALDPEPENIAAFCRQRSLIEGAVLPTRTVPVRHILLPAACYALYAAHQGRQLDRTLFLTTRGLCHRRETHYEPLRRQWSFGMREIVCLGEAEDMARFITAADETLLALAASLGLEARLQPASDPFFGEAQGKRLMQQIDPVKYELVVGDLAIASVNRHRTLFGRAFDITCKTRPASSACLAFGLERWIAVILDRFGADPAHWPALEALS